MVLVSSPAGTAGAEEVLAAVVWVAARKRTVERKTAKVRRAEQCQW